MHLVTFLFSAENIIENAPPWDAPKLTSSFSLMSSKDDTILDKIRKVVEIFKGI